MALSGGLYRIRYTGRPTWLPINLRARHGSIELTFTDPLDHLPAVEAGQGDIEDDERRVLVVEAGNASWPVAPDGP
jgi:hypothetical protein